MNGLSDKGIKVPETLKLSPVMILEVTRYARPKSINVGQPLYIVVRSVCA